MLDHLAKKLQPVFKEVISEMSLLALHRLCVNAICHKTQAAAAAMVQARVTAGAQEEDIPLASIFPGIGIGDLTARRVVLVCKRAVPQTPWEGNWDADLQVQVIGAAADFDSADDFHAYAGQVFAFFFQEPETVCATPE
jgi:hypothetical protein